MPPSQISTSHVHHRRSESSDGSWRNGATSAAFVLEAWGEGCMFGALMIMACTTVAGMRKGVLLHKLILLEACRRCHVQMRLLT